MRDNNNASVVMTGQYIIVTRVIRDNGRVITNTYGPYRDRNHALRSKRAMSNFIWYDVEYIIRPLIYTYEKGEKRGV